MISILGIDMAKAKFQVALRSPEGKLRQKSCPNTTTGFKELGAWLTRHGVTQVHACLEATGTFGEALATWLYDAGHAVSVVNPAVIHAYARAQLRRTKTDALDAALIADYAATQQPALWAPAPPEVRQLQALVRRLDALYAMRTQETNRLAAGVDVAEVQASIEAVLARLDEQVAQVRQLIREHIDRHPPLRQQQALLQRGVVRIEGQGALIVGDGAGNIIVDFGDAGCQESARKRADVDRLIGLFGQSRVACKRHADYRRDAREPSVTS